MAKRKPPTECEAEDDMPGLEMDLEPINIAKMVDKLIGERGFKNAIEIAAKRVKFYNWCKEPDMEADWLEVHRILLERQKGTAGP